MIDHVVSQRFAACSHNAAEGRGHFLQYTTKNKVTQPEKKASEDVRKRQRLFLLLNILQKSQDGSRAELS